MLEDVDRLILRELQQNARLSSEELGERIGLSRSSTQRRVQILRETGVIEKEIAVLDPQLADHGMMFVVVVEVELERERVDLLDELRRSMTALEEVQQC